MPDLSARVLVIVIAGDAIVVRTLVVTRRSVISVLDDHRERYPWLDCLLRAPVSTSTAARKAVIAQTGMLVALRAAQLKLR